MGYEPAMTTAAIVPAFDAERRVGDVIESLLRIWPGPVWLVDDGSTDTTAEVASRAGATVVRHPRNLGKGAALRTGMRAALAAGCQIAVTIDADGQHLPSEALRLHQCCDDPHAIVIGVRDLAGAGAPLANQRSNRFSNLVLSAFTGTELHDTQCGLRRYPLASTLALEAKEDGYGYEAEVLIRAVARGIRIVHEPVRVTYPPAAERITHFDSVRDPARIVARVVTTVLELRARSLTKWIAGRAHAQPSEGE
jgi:glycosyltransferase involved in cell wall biosynthesis